MRIAAVILAGGEGHRIGGDKPLKLLGGRPLMDHVLARARRWSPDVGLSLRHRNQFQAADGVAALPDKGGAGPMAGLRSALVFARSRGADAALTIPCDVPFVPADLPRRLASALSDRTSAALATSDGQLHPACALWKTDVLESLTSYAATGRSSLRGFAAHVGFVTVDWPVEPFDPFFNVNNAADLATAEAVVRSR